MHRSLRHRVVLLVVVATLATAGVAAIVGTRAVDGLSRLARQQAAATVLRESERRVVGQAEDLANAEDLRFGAVRGAAEALAQYVAWLYDHPGYFPRFLEGGSPLLPTPQGHLVNDAATAVGVFVPAAARYARGLWDEVGLLSFADPLLATSMGAASDASRIWIVSASGIVRLYPNQRLGHPDSPVGADHDFRLDEPYRAAVVAAAAAASPEDGPGDDDPDPGTLLTVWTQPYIDPATGRRMITACAPVLDALGGLRAVVGLDMEFDLFRETPPVTPVGAYSFLVDPDANVVGATRDALADLGLAEYVAGGEGLTGHIPLSASSVPGVRPLADLLRSPEGTGCGRYDGARGTRFLGYAPLASTGWTFCWSVPERALAQSAVAIEDEIDALRLRYGLNLLAGAAVAAALLSLAGSLVGRGITRPLAELAAGVRRIGADLGHQLGDLGSDEIGEVGRELNRMTGLLETSQAQALAAAEQAAAERRARLVAVLDERTRLAGEIHDTIAQGLAGIVIQLRNLDELLDSGDAPGARAAASHAAELGRDSLADARRSVWNLRPRPLDAARLDGALAALAAEHTRAGRLVRVDLPQGALDLPGDVEAALLRVAQEALLNAFKHGGVREVQLSLAVTGGGVELAVADQGRGFDAAAAEQASPLSPGGRADGSGFGLWAMRERLAAIGGELVVSSQPGRGTTVLARVAEAVSTEQGRD